VLAALEPGCAREDELVAELTAGQAQLWAGARCALVTQCVRDPSGLSLHVWLAGGDLDEILALRPGLEAWGRAMGCTRLTLNGRKGWARVLRPHGFRPAGDDLERRL